MVDILARLKIRAEEFSRGADQAFGRFEQQAAKSGNRAGDEFARGLSARLDALTTGAGVAAIVSLGQRALDHVQTLKKESQQLGISTKALQEYRFAAAEVGVEQQDLSDSFTDLTQKIGEARGGNKDAKEAFRDLGIDIDTTTGRAKSMEGVFNELIGKLSQVSDPTERARLEAQLFGDEWRKIDPMLRAGAGRIDALRQAANEFGAVISDDAIQNTDATARKVQQMKMVLEANIADAVAKNSGAILGLANSLTRMTGSLAQWWSQNPEKAYALMGAAGGARVGFTFGGFPGAVVGLGAGYVGGSAYGKADKQAADDANMTLSFRRQQALNAKKELDAMRAAQASGSLLSFRRSGSDRSGGTVQQAEAEVMRQAKLLWRAAQAAQAPATRRTGSIWTSPVTVDPESSGGSGSSGGRASGRSASSGKSDADRELEKQNEAEQRLRESLEETIQRQRDSQQLADLRARGLDRQADLQEAMLEIQRQFPGLEGTTNAEAAKLLGIREEQVAPLREQYELLKEIRTAEVNRDADAAEAKARVENERKAQEEIDRLREEADERQRRSIEDLSRLYYDLFSGHSSDIWRDFKREGMEVMATLAAQWTIAQFSGRAFDPLTALNTATSTMGFGGPASAILSALTNGGGRASGLAEQAAAEGGDAGQIAAAAGLAKQFGATSGLSGIAAGAASVLGPLAMASAANSMIGEIFGFKGGPLGVLTGPISNLINPSRSAGATITGLDSVSIGGKDKKQYGVASGLADSVLSGLKDLADQLGGSVGSFRTTIGIRDGDYRVNPTGSSLKTKNGAVEFDDDAEGAIAYAIADAVSDGAIMGISEASKRLLTSGADLSEAIQKAAAIEAIPKALQARLDPVGYAIEQLNDKWDDTWAALKEGAATAEQMAEAQQLYNLELEEVKSSTASAAQSLKDYLKAMDAGSSSPLSLRDQEKAAYDELAVYLDKIGKGQSIDQSAYLDAAQTWLDIERQLYGSTSKYFEAFDAIQAATSSAISSIENVSSIAGASDQLAQETASAAKTTATTTTSMAADTSNMVLLLERQLAASQALLKALGASDGSTFTGTSRNY